MRNLSINILCAVNWFIKFVWTVIWVVHKNLLTCPILYIKTWKKTILTRNIRKVETSLNYWDNCKLVHCWATLIRNLLSYWGIRMCVQYLFSYPRTYIHNHTYCAVWSYTQTNVEKYAKWYLTGVVVYFTHEKSLQRAFMYAKICINITGINMIWQWRYFLSDQCIK